MASSKSCYHFDEFLLDIENRQLLRNGEELDLNSRYFDALVLLVQRQGKLVEKDQFFSEVWDGVIVSDAALTQCIKDVRKQLEDKASNPKYIETVPGYGYRFIAPVEICSSEDLKQNGKGDLEKSATEKTSQISSGKTELQKILIEGGAGTLGGISAGVLGGLLYGFALIYAPGEREMGAISMLLVLVGLNSIIGGLGGLGVSFGMVTPQRFIGNNKLWMIAGAALGGLFIGELTKLLGVDAFNLLFGSTPSGITGGLEGSILGSAIAMGAILGGGFNAKRSLYPVMGAAVAGCLGGVLISFLGGHLMGGSLKLFVQSFGDSKLQLDALGYYFGEIHFGFITQTLLSGIEGFLFGACVVGGIVLRYYLSDSAALEPL